MTTQPNTRPIDPKRSLTDLFPTRFLKAQQLVTWGVNQIYVIIDSIQEEEVLPHPGEPAEWKPVMYFLDKNGKLHPQGYLLSAHTDVDALRSATGAETIADLVGKRVSIKLDT